MAKGRRETVRLLENAAHFLGAVFLKDDNSKSCGVCGIAEAPQGEA